MIIGKIPKHGAAIELNKWYFGMEILKCPPSMVGIFRPYILFIFVKFKDLGEPYKINGREENKVGGWKYWTSPIGIEFRFKITRY